MPALGCGDMLHAFAACLDEVQGLGIKKSGNVGVTSPLLLVLSGLN